MDFEPETSGMSGTGSKGSAGSSEDRILVCVSRPETMSLAALVEAGTNWSCHVADGVDGLRAKLVDHRFEVVIIPAPDFDDRLAADIRRLQPNASVVMAAANARVDEVTRTMRLGASDFLPGDLDADKVEDRLSLAITRSRELLHRDRSVKRLANLEGHIDSSGDAPVDLAAVSPTDTETGDEGRIAMCSEFRTLLRQELDVEDLLRTALEYLLVKTGPTNAAVYLAGGDGRFGLGAYVNFEHARRTVEPML
ncbi:MAG: response regulator, partial [Phycisphaera sp.]|nr:response regulator [Phycisphaera sp.]